MKNLLSIPKGHGHYYILSLVLILFIIFPVEIPKELGSLVDSVLGKIVVVEPSLAGTFQAAFAISL